MDVFQIARIVLSAASQDVSKRFGDCNPPVEAPTEANKRFMGHRVTYSFERLYEIGGTGSNAMSRLEAELMQL